MQGDGLAVQRGGGQIAQRRIAFLRLGLHGDLVAEAAGHGVVGAQMHHALIAVDQNLVAVQRLGNHALGVNHHRNRQRAGHNRRMAADRAFFQHHAFQLAAIVQEFRRPDVAGDKNGVVRHGRAGVLALPGQDAQQPVRQIVQIMQPVAQIGVLRLFQPRPRRGLLFLHRRLGRKAALNVLLHPAQPAARMGEHAIGFQHRLLVLVEAFGLQQVIDRDAQHAHRLADAVDLGQRVVGDRVRHHYAGFVQPDPAFRRALLPGAAAKDHRLLVQRLNAVARQDAQLGHLGQHHGHDFQRLDLLVGKLARGLRLHDQHAQLFADPLDRHAEERGIDLLARLGHEAKTLFARRIGGVHRQARARDTADQPLAQLHPGLVDSGLVQPLGRAQLQRLGIAEQIDRTHLGPHRIGDQMGDLVQPFLPLGGGCQHIAQAAQKFAAVAFAAFGHRRTFVLLIIYMRVLPRRKIYLATM